MLVRNGYLTLGHWSGTPVRAHWTLPLGAFIFGQARLVPGFWVGFFLVVFIHEIGHALLVRRFRLMVVGIEIHGVGGLCRWAGNPTAIQRATIAWGGVAAQAIALLVALAAIQFLGPPPTAFAAQLAHAFTTGNLWLMALNLIPVPPLDGTEAWKLPGLLRARRRRRIASSASPGVPPRAAIEREMAALDASYEADSAEAKAAADAALRRIMATSKAKKP